MFLLSLYPTPSPQNKKRPEVFSYFQGCGKETLAWPKLLIYYATLSYWRFLDHKLHIDRKLLMWPKWWHHLSFPFFSRAITGPSINFIPEIMEGSKDTSQIGAILSIQWKRKNKLKDQLRCSTRLNFRTTPISFICERLKMLQIYWTQ